MYSKLIASSAAVLALFASHGAATIVLGTFNGASGTSLALQLLSVHH
jgi:hypothetical protein